MKNLFYSLLLSAMTIFLIACAPNTAEVGLEESVAIDEVISSGALDPAPTTAPTVEPESEPGVDLSDSTDSELERAENSTEGNDGASESIITGDEVPLPEPDEAIASDEMMVESGAAVSTLNDGAAIPDSALLVDFDPFESTEFQLGVDLPRDIPNLPVLVSDANNSSYAQAAQIAQSLGFQVPLYQEAVSIDEQAYVELSDEGFWIGRPFYAFSEDGILTIFGESAYYENRQTIEFERALTDETLLIPAAQAILASWSGLDFEYDLLVTAPGTVELRRLVDGIPSNYTEVFLNFDNSGSLIYFSYNLLPGEAQQETVPLISAEEAWSKVTGGVIKNNIEYQLDVDFTALDDPLTLDLSPEGYSFWNRSYEGGELVNLYGYTSIFYPFQDDSAPVVYINDFRVLGDEFSLVEMGMNGPTFVKLAGEVAADGKTFNLNSWEAIDDNQVSIRGVVSVTEDGLLVESSSGEQYVIRNGPSDLPSDQPVFVSGYLSNESVNGAAVLDWQFVEAAGGDLSNGIVAPLPIEEPISSLPRSADTFGVITIENISFIYGVEFNYGDEESLDPGNIVVPGTTLRPMYAFEGVTGAGDGITFYVPAVE